MPLAFTQEAQDNPSLHLPRILCLHGGGSNAKIFQAQCRKLNAQLKAHFRLVFADAPYSSQAGPDVMSVYADWAPFRRWLRWTLDHPEITADEAVMDIEDSLQRAINEDDRKGGTGEWVALLGFSQGAKMCASLLFHQQMLADKLGARLPWGGYKRKLNFRFAVIMAGRGPLVSMDPELVMTSAFHDAATPSLSSYDAGSLNRKCFVHYVLRIPTIHVHGKFDPGLKMHQRFMEEFFEKESVRLVSWDGDHRVPLRSGDVSAVVDQILDLSEQTGVFEDLNAFSWVC
ncbi:hypothetical protein V501_00646 [Pseudogymnoascus sp. VKM F-4519 (FW-2642)]|nr:hypothetical protein V501_00646 [Pseudogymnoascus sp. VKM F-4519 (FW-2642)]